MLAGPLDALFEMHTSANDIVRKLLEDPEQDWSAIVTLDLPWLPAQLRKASRRKLMAHMLFHSQRHWAQLATLVRSAGFPSGLDVYKRQVQPTSGVPCMASLKSLTQVVLTRWAGKDTIGQRTQI